VKNRYQQASKMCLKINNNIKSITSDYTNLAYP